MFRSQMVGVEPLLVCKMNLRCLHFHIFLIGLGHATCTRSRRNPSTPFVHRDVQRLRAFAIRIGEVLDRHNGAVRVVVVLVRANDDADGAPRSPLSAGRLGACVAYAEGVAGVQLSSRGVCHRCCCCAAAALLELAD